MEWSGGVKSASISGNHIFLVYDFVDGANTWSGVEG
jgi:hypothetical protein